MGEALGGAGGVGGVGEVGEVGEVARELAEGEALGVAPAAVVDAVPGAAAAERAGAARPNVRRQDPSAAGACRAAVVREVAQTGGVRRVVVFGDCELGMIGEPHAVGAVGVGAGYDRPSPSGVSGRRALSRYDRPVGLAQASCRSMTSR